MRKYFVLVGLLLLIAGSALAQGEYPTVETSPAFMFIHTTPPGAGQGVNCAGGGGTIAYNLTSLLGIAADMGGCKIFGFIPSSSPLSGKINGNEFTYLFGPRLTYRSGSRFEPFAELNFGGMRISVSCNSSALSCVNATGGNTFTKNAFAMTVGGGFQVKLSQKFSLRLVQAEYLYTRFGNNCALAVCNNNNSQNSFRLKSGIVINW